MEEKQFTDKRRVIDTRAYVEALRELVLEGKEVSMRIWGVSMTPFLGHDRDTIFFEKPDRPLKAGDMVFYQRENGQFVMHRIMKVKKDGYYITGDAQTFLEGPISEKQIFARITKAMRKGKLITDGDFWWDFFKGPWRYVRPIRPIILKLYGALHGLICR